MTDKENSEVLYNRLQDTTKSLSRLGVKEAVFKLPTEYIDSLIKAIDSNFNSIVVKILGGDIKHRSIKMYGVTIYFEEIK